jgi:hypothetical protein
MTWAFAWDLFIIQSKEKYDAVDSVGHYFGRRRGDSLGYQQLHTHAGHD